MTSLKKVNIKDIYNNLMEWNKYHI